MYSVSFTDANTGTAVGGGPTSPATGRILRTIDGGANWTLKTSPIANRTLYGVCFTDANNGTAVGMAGAIIHTSDGGTTWASQASGVTGNLYGVNFTDANTGTAVGAGSLGSGTILRTTDGGATWVPQTAVITSNGFYSVHFTDANNGTAVGQGGVVVHTTDGGANWITQSSGVGWNLQGVCFTDANTGWAVGSGGIIHTTDGGLNWIQQAGGASLYSVSMTDSNTGTAVGVAGKIFHTTDGGVNWIEQISGTSVDLRGITCLPSGSCFAVGKMGTIIGSTIPPAQPSAILGLVNPEVGSSQEYSVVNVAGVTYNWTFPLDWVQTGGGTTNVLTVTVGTSAGDIQVIPSTSYGTGTPRTLAVSPISASKSLNLIVFLEGLYDGAGLMHKAQGIAGDQFPGTTADQVTVELHNATTGALEYSLGNINLSTSGVISGSVPAVHNGSYYIYIIHRNSITVSSVNPVSFAGSSISYDFSTGVTQAFGSNMKDISGVAVAFAGEATQDCGIDSSDMIAVDNDNAAFASGYLVTDINGDGGVDSSDMILVDNNNAAFIGCILPF